MVEVSVCCAKFAKGYLTRLWRRTTSLVREVDEDDGRSVDCIEVSRKEGGRCVEAARKRFEHGRVSMSAGVVGQGAEKMLGSMNTIKSRRQGKNPRTERNAKEEGDVGRRN